ncbi:MAG TPA: hypothetical protein VM165_02525, partial [Planctomycetaceae bacterium]|nr:hypothetical protein [Planctomycetaceae bacterium]
AGAEPGENASIAPAPSAKPQRINKRLRISGPSLQSSLCRDRSLRLAIETRSRPDAVCLLLDLRENALENRHSKAVFYGIMDV